MSRVTTEIDRSRNGFLVHSAKNAGRHLEVVVYVEGLDDPRYAIEERLICRTAEQSAAIARALNEPIALSAAKDAALAAAREVYAQSLASNGHATFEAWAKLGDALDVVDGK